MEEVVEFFCYFMTISDRYMIVISNVDRHKIVLQWPKHHSNTAAVSVLDVPTMMQKCRVLIRKLGFLWRVMAGDSDGLSGSVMLALCNEADSICLVRKCRELEEPFGTHFTN